MKSIPHYIEPQAKIFRMAAIALTMLTGSFAGAVLPAQAQTFTSLYSFQGGNNHDGSYPNGLVQGTNGYLYGSAASNTGGIFKISTDGKETPLYNFDTGEGDPDGEGSWAGLILASNGSFYGTSQGNSGGCGGPNGTCGVFYKITAKGKLTILYDFCSNNPNGECLDGTTTESALVQASNGDFYGTNNVYGANGAGTIFKITPGGKLTTLHAFCSTRTQNNYCADGEPPYSALVEGNDGNLYGTTTFGGDNNEGTIFSITLSGKFTTLHNVGDSGDLGENPRAALVVGADGNFYGTTALGGVSTYCAGNCGTFFKMTPGGTLTTLYSFCSLQNCADGAAPQTLILAGDGNFYGMTGSGGTDSYGTLFQITPTGGLTTLHSFDGTDGVVTYGSYPGPILIQATSGTFYGTTVEGGAGWPNQCNGCNGTAFSLAMGLSPFVKTLPASGKVGVAVKILGTNLKGATMVTFNGTPAVFKVVSGGSEITTKVPVGATTGLVQVTTPAGTLSSNVFFQVP
jgi:uncharacterized repeat protein (TIGR03803 family)